MPKDRDRDEIFANGLLLGWFGGMLTFLAIMALQHISIAVAWH